MSDKEIDTESSLEYICGQLGELFVEFYSEMIKLAPASLVITGMAGALASCAAASGEKRESVIEALNSAFDDIEAGEPQTDSQKGTSPQ